MTAAAPPCAITAGLILRRTCGATSTTKCARCLRAACEAHIRHLQSAAGPADLCVECMPKSAATPTRSSTSSSSSSGGVGWIDTSSGIGDGGGVPDWTESAGGQFGGGGASGGWSDEPASAAGDAAKIDDAGFTPQDYAAFDALSDSDKSDGSHGYDS